MKKIYLFMLMAVGLLISTSMFAAPERPVLGQQEPQSAEFRISPQGVEQLVPMATPQPKHSQSSLARAPRKAAMAGDVLKVVKPSGEEVFYDATNFNTVWDNLVEGDSIVLLGNIGTYYAYITVDNVTLDLNGHYLVSSYDGETSLSSQLYLLITTGNNIVIKNGYVWDDNYTFIYSDGKAYSNYGIEAWGGSLTLENVTTDGDYWGSAYMIYAGNNATVEIKDCEINSCFYAIYNAGADITINQSEGKNCKIEGHYDKTIYQTKGSITLEGGTITNSSANCVQLYAGTFTMTGGTVTTSVGHAVYQYAYYDASTINIQGGTIENTANVNPSNSNASCIYTVDSKAATVNISDGVFKPSVNSTDINGVAVYASCVGGGPKVYITGGTFYSPRTHDHIFYRVANTTFSVKGGYFEQPSIGTHISLPIGYSFLPQNEEGFYEVSNVLFTIKGKGGYTYEEVKTVWEDGDEVTLKRPTTIEDGTIVIDKSVSLNLTEYSMENLSVAAGKTVNVYGTQEASIKAFAGEGTIIVHSGTYPFDPTTYLAPGLSAQKNESKNVWVVGDGPQVSMNDVSYWTLADAFAVAPDNEQATIKLLRSVTMSKGISIDKKKNVVLELNGFTISCDEHMASSINMFVNYGTLTVQDNTDIEGKGNGTGKIAYAVENPDATLIPSSSANVFTNRGVMYVKSGAIHNDGTGLACYAIDNYANGNNAELYMTGGKLTSNASTSIRMCIFKSTKNIISIKNAVIGSLWLQEYNGTEGQGYLDIEDSEILYNIKLGYDDDNAELENLSVIFKNISIGVEFVSIFNPNARNADSSYVMDNNVIRAYYVDYPYPCLTNGFYQFNSKKEYKLVAASAAKDYPEDDGWICIPDESQPGFVRVYMSAQKLLRDFYQHIVPGYGLVARPEFKKDKDGNYEPAWYEIVPLKGSGEDHSPKTNSDSIMNSDTGLDENGKPAVETITGDTIVGKNEQGQNVTADGTVVDDKDLANIWHRTYTWEEDTIPVSGDPVVIDHNVIVEKDSTAEAASIIIEPGQKLIVQEGATLHIEDAGAIFKDSTAQLIVEPNAVVTVGSNGIVADDEDNVIVKASETEQGVFMCDPEVKINTKPKATVYLYTKAKQLRGAPKYEYIYQRFAIPTDDGEATVYGDDYAGQELFEGEINYVDAVFAWDKDNIDWKMLARWKDMKPFEGYQVTNNTKNGGITYSFEGNLVGNHNSNFEFAYHPEGFQFFGNSYTAPIYIPTFLDSIQKHNGNEIEYSIWVYDEGDDTFKPVTKVQAEAGLVKDAKGNPITEIRSMQAFIMKGAEGSSTDLSYEGAIWGNPRFENRLPGSAQASRRTTALDMDIATIIVKAQNGQGDQVLLMQSNNFSDEFENGSDASKYIYAEGINLYANTNCGKLSNVATDNVDGTILAFKSGASSEYTIRFDNLNGEMFTLVDMVTGTQVAMTEGNEYTFSQAPNTDNEVRFMVMGEHKAPTGNENIKTNKITKVVENGQFYIVKEGIRYNAVGASFNK